MYLDQLIGKFRRFLRLCWHCRPSRQGMSSTNTLSANRLRLGKDTAGQGSLCEAQEAFDLRPELPHAADATLPLVRHHLFDIPNTRAAGRNKLLTVAALCTAGNSIARPAETRTTRSSLRPPTPPVTTAFHARQSRQSSQSRWEFRTAAGTFAVSARRRFRPISPDLSP